MSDFQIFAEWRIKRLPEPPREPRETYNERVKRWTLSSIGIEGMAQDLFLYLEKTNMATMDDLAKRFGGNAEEIQKELDLLYTAGLIDKLGKAYLVREGLSASITRRLLPRITETLRGIAKTESDSRSYADYYRKMRGRAFSDIREAIAAFKEISRMGGSPTVRVVGVHGYSNESIELEGPVVDHGYDPPHLVILSDSGDKVVVGGRKASGVDVQAHTIIIKGESND
ncbi:MAG: TrmB family transcriptional regulator sugar-binding domain-containing protein [Candidatus Bathyarchaeia archaeon]